MLAESKTLGLYLLDCLKKEGIQEIFGVPGDYNFSLLDTLKDYEGIQFVNNRNELNAGYAADAYARLNGISALITTFGVGELSACNAIAGSYSESVPVIHIVGSPKSAMQEEKALAHHTLMDRDFDVFRKMYDNLTAYTAVLTPENAAREIPAAIEVAKKKKKPVYLSVAIDLVTQPIIPSEKQTIEEGTKDSALKAAIAHSKTLLAGANNAVILADMKTIRYGLQDQVQQLAEQWNVPVASSMQGKSAFDESHPQYIGVYGGAFGDQEVTKIVEGADTVIAVGALWSDVNTSKNTIKLDPLKVVEIQPDSVKVGEASYMKIQAADFIRELSGIGFKQEGKLPETSFPYDTVTGGAEEPIRAASYYPRIQHMLKENDVIITETGTLSYGMSQVRLPKGATYIAQGGWQSIGYATPAAFGACIAARDRRVLLFTGDGSLQLTVQEISSMLENDCKPIIFVLNNNGYTIEKYLNVQVKVEKQTYNEIPMWNYTKLPEVFGRDVFTAQVKTNDQLDEAISQVGKLNGEQLCLIELIVDDPMDAPAYLQKMREAMEQ
ncbi:thiamine pyrophosphate-binding protein [Fictibacillus enclensis]|uniref:alpha-keto acid decarboxylase family protein n=1 Tax=Fictibacillus enclensis TaxID=1017270 RepID=UPI0025A0365F|nr:thiamine pyrophosphate-binding protein [Fictibacillus enclensis]MDM5337260.1 thiamine pyrophosphate-binding protein [Fictibacillus enclensis]